MMNSLLQILEVELEDKQHAIAQDAEYWESIPEGIAPKPLENPDVRYKQGYATGIVGGQQDKRYGWSLDYAMGYSTGISEWVLDNPDSQIPVCVEHSENDEF